MIPGGYTLPKAAHHGDRLAVLVGVDGVIDPLRQVVQSSASRRQRVELRTLRRHLVTAPVSHALVCISLDDATLSRYGLELTTFVADLRGFPVSTTSIGLIPDGQLSGSNAAIGCDVYVTDLSDLKDVAHELGTPRATFAGAVDRWTRLALDAPLDIEDGPESRLVTDLFFRLRTFRETDRNQGLSPNDGL